MSRNFARVAAVVSTAALTFAGAASAQAAEHHVAKQTKTHVTIVRLGNFRAHVETHAKRQVKPRRRAADSSSAPQPTGVAGNWNLVLNSQFNGPALPADWQTGWFGNGVTNSVNQREQDCYSPSNVSLPGDGSVHLAVTATASTCGGTTKPYTGAAITTNPSDGRSGSGFQYTYGVVEARVYIPASGTKIANWPAVWADGQSWPADGEDDLMEGLGGTACWHFHDPVGGPGGCAGTVKPGWHTFASAWQPGSVTYYYDGIKVGKITTGITSAPMYLILDDTVAAGQSETTTAMRVQYVRVWQS